MSLILTCHRPKTGNEAEKIMKKGNQETPYPVYIPKLYELLLPPPVEDGIDVVPGIIHHLQHACNPPIDQTKAIHPFIGHCLLAMLTRTLLLSAAGLLLFCPPQTSGKLCTGFLSNSTTPEHDSGFITNVSCSYKALAQSNQTRVTITGFISKPMVGWQVSLQPRSPGTEKFKIADVSLGEVVNQSNINVVFLKRLDRLEEGDSFQLQFAVFSSKKDTSLFPATFHLSEPVPPSGSGMCAGEDIQPPSHLQSRISSTKRKILLNFGKIGGHIRWLYCKLNFFVPGRILELKNAEYVKDLVISRSSEVNKKPKTTVVFGIFANTTIEDVYKHSFCRACLVDPKTGMPVPEPSTPVVDTPVVRTRIATSAPITSPTIAQTETSRHVTTWRRHGTTTASDGNIGIGKSTIQTTESRLATDTESGRTIEETTQSWPTSPQSSLPKSGTSDQSENRTAVWTGVAAACAGGLIVLLIVVVVWIASRRRSATVPQPEAARSCADSAVPAANTYVTSPTNGQPLVNYPSNSQFPCIPYSPDGCLENGSVQYDYAELHMYHFHDGSDLTKVGGTYDNVGDGNTFLRLSDMLPGQRLQYLEQYRQQNGTVELELTDYHGTPHPDDPFASSVTDSGYEAMHIEKTYVEMVSPNVKKAEDGQQFEQDVQDAAHGQGKDDEQGEHDVQERQDNEDNQAEQDN